MEFMYCIPDLGVFIDKTIKKCLLEYDLDANDTEAVLDDMEKAWPKSPPRPAEKHEDSQINRHVNEVKHVDESAPNAVITGKAESYGNSAYQSEIKEKHPSSGDQPVTVLSNDKKESETTGADCYHSDSSSPDAGDGKNQFLKHPKLKSRLQQRYFEGTKKNCNSEDEVVKICPAERSGESQDPIARLPSNLDILASAANIHSESSLGVVNPTPRQHEDPGRPCRDLAVKPFLVQKDSSQETNAQALLPSSTQPGQYCSANSFVAGGNSSSHMPCPREEQLHSRSSIYKGKAQEDNRTLHLTSEKMSFFHHHQNGYHALIPRETVVVRRGCLSSIVDRDPGKWKPPGFVPQPALMWPTVSDRSAPATHYHPFPSRMPSDRNYQYQRLDGYQKALHYYESRIASIIADELQKDENDSCSAETLPQQHIPSVSTNTPADMKHYHDRCQSNSFNLATPSKFPEQLSHIPDSKSSVSKTNQTVDSNKCLVQTNFRTANQLLSAHQIRTDIHSKTVLAHQPRHTTSTRNVSQTNFAIANKPHDDDLPEDLSTKSRKNAEFHTGYHRRSSINPSPESPATENRSCGYFSSPCSPVCASSSGRPIESPALRKSPSPSNHSDRECDYNSGNSIKNNPLRTAGKWERIGQAHGAGVYSPGGQDSRALVVQRTRQALKRWSEAECSETSKKIKME